MLEVLGELEFISVEYAVLIENFIILVCPSGSGLTKQNLFCQGMAYSMIWPTSCALC